MSCVELYFITLIAYAHSGLMLVYAGLTNKRAIMFANFALFSVHNCTLLYCRYVRLVAKRPHMMDHLTINISRYIIHCILLYFIVR